MYQSLQIQEETFKAQEHSLALAKRQTCAQQLNQLLNEIRSSLQHAEGQLEALQQQEQELKQTLNKSAEEAGLAGLLQPVPILLIWISCNSVAQCCSTALPANSDGARPSTNGCSTRRTSILRRSIEYSKATSAAAATGSDGCGDKLSS